MGFDKKAITDAIYAEFIGDADLLAALGGSERRMYPDKAPADPNYPYAVFQYITGVPDPTFNTDGETMQFQFDVYHKDEDSPRDRTTINDVLKKLTTAYDDAVLTITGSTSVAVTRGVSGSLPTTDFTQREMVMYEIMTEDD